MYYLSMAQKTGISVKRWEKKSIGKQNTKKELCRNIRKWRIRHNEEAPQADIEGDQK